MLRVQAEHNTDISTFEDDTRRVERAKSVSDLYSEPDGGLCLTPPGLGGLNPAPNPVRAYVLPMLRGFPSGTHNPKTCVVV